MPAGYQRADALPRFLPRNVSSRSSLHFLSFASRHTGQGLVNLAPNRRTSVQINIEALRRQGSRRRLGRDHRAVGRTTRRAGSHDAACRATDWSDLKQKQLRTYLQLLKAHRERVDSLDEYKIGKHEFDIKNNHIKNNSPNEMRDLDQEITNGGDSANHFRHHDCRRRCRVLVVVVHVDIIILFRLLRSH